MVTSNAQELHDKGEQLIDNGNASEAIDFLAQAVDLSPNNAQYRATLASAQNEVGNHEEAERQARCALEIEPNLFAGYAELADAQEKQHKHTDALDSLSRALEIYPDDVDLYEWRSEVNGELGNWEDALVDIARCFQLDPHREPRLWSSADPQSKTNRWYQDIRKHVMEILLPQFTARGEQFVEYWPCYIEWDKRSERAYAGGIEWHVRCGSGYLCLTTKNIYLVSIGRLSLKFSRVSYLQGLVLGGIFGDDEYKAQRDLCSTDQFWMISYSKVTSMQIIGREGIRLDTPALNWEIYELFSSQIPEIWAGINAGLSGKFQQKPPMTAPPVKTNTESENVISLLKQLGELRTQGIINEAEFELKKKELLARL